MTETAKASKIAIKPKDRIIIALDVASADDAREIIGELRGEAGIFKIGLQLFTAAGPEFVREVTNNGIDVFLDLKFHDIPNTVAMAAVEAAKMGVWMFNVHASGGSEMMRRTVDAVNEACSREGRRVPKIIGVTVLTSSDDSTLSETGVTREIGQQVAALASLAEKSGLDGVVASPHEVLAIREAFTGPDFLVVTPGIRPVSATYDDQRRVTTFAQAIRNGSDYVVVGRPVTQAADRRSALMAMLAETDKSDK